MHTLSEENYLKAIYHLGQQGTTVVGTNSIADRMDTKASSVTDMLKRLSEKELAHYVKYKGVSLTTKGQLIAASIIRKHRLWEVFLVEKLNFNWDEVHDVAEQLEHIKSDALIDNLDAFLGSPTRDPHGEPIPDRHGNIPITKPLILLSEALINSHVVCSGVVDSSSSFLKYLDKQGIGIGTVIEIISKEDYDNSLTVVIKGRTLELSQKVTNNIYINNQLC